MKLKEFFKLTNQKVKITVLLVVFNYIILNLTNIITGIMMPSYHKMLNDFVISLLKQPDYLSFSFQNMIYNFFVLIIVSYLFACVIDLMFWKRGKK